MTKILALIHNGNLTTNEAIVASSKAKSGWILIAPVEIVKEYAQTSEDVSPFQTSKSLTDLKKKFEAQGIKAVYLHEKEIRFCECCLLQEPEHVNGCPRPIDEFKTVKQKPLMLAVFGDEDKIKEIIGEC